VEVKKGCKVKVEYTGSLDDGTVFDSSEKRGPLEFEAGAGQVIPGFDKAIMGMKEGEEKEVKIECADAYGDPNPEAVQKVPKDKLPQGQEIKEGMMLIMNLPNGMKIPARIVKVEDNEVTVDFNHPLAGKDLNFKIKIVEICE